MDLNHIAGELAGPRHDDLTREQFAGRIRAALESVQAETERRTLERAAQVIENGQERFSTGLDGENNRDLSPRSNGNIAGLAYAEAIRALIDKPAPPDPLLVALAGLFADNWREIPLRMLIKAGLVDADYHAKLTELGKAAIALAEAGR